MMSFNSNVSVERKRVKNTGIAIYQPRFPVSKSDLPFSVVVTDLEFIKKSCYQSNIKWRNNSNILNLALEEHFWPAADLGSI